MKLNFKVVENTKEVKILEGKLLLEDYEELDKIIQELTKYMGQLEKRLKELNDQQFRGNYEDLVAEIEQKERII